MLKMGEYPRVQYRLICIDGQNTLHLFLSLIGQLDLGVGVRFGIRENDFPIQAQTQTHFS